MELEVFEKGLLEEFGRRLKDYGFSIQKLEADEEQGEGLRCFFHLPQMGEGEEGYKETNETKGEETIELPTGEIMAVELDFLELGQLPVLQYYFYVRENVSEEQKEALRPAIEECNAVTPLGQMGFFEDDLYYRYSQVFSGDESVEEAAGRCEDVLSLLIVALQINMEDIDEYIEP